MPKSNFCQPKTDERLDFLREAVDGGMSRNKIKVKELSTKTGINKSTLYKRRRLAGDHDNRRAVNLERHIEDRQSSFDESTD